MSPFLSNLPPSSRSRVPHGSGAASSKQPPVSSFPAVVPTSAVAVNLSPNVAGSLIPTHGINEDLTTLMEPSEFDPRWTRENFPWMRVYSVKESGLRASKVMSLYLVKALWQMQGTLVTKRNFEGSTRVPI